ncbi:predicted protein [Sclerotinia sclerotiorum 1980 UF-70]|uniref:Uncharacterized protein n=1 Tax=Sclerotinia sclerotiorum (strain ATCC 18683 / 1980 / Ss-1) TaxID=665079 RepID=A7EYT1_SCLS1|nr:predicted protein [Sclerotinia sclerotiorum 1980 UF-70]EDN94623.1 predicted protein [Sclerotinia sclerotiorum 1980 UF-70]
MVFLVSKKWEEREQREESGRSSYGKKETRYIEETPTRLHIRTWNVRLTKLD